ncbi:unnamed protein product [Amoebophrya sp. A120]|nr:unnamed protein product [Amoebophrya sp. A120]|eukprot:GSA120T00016196001.1
MINYNTAPPREVADGGGSGSASYVDPPALLYQNQIQPSPSRSPHQAAAAPGPPQPRNSAGQLPPPAMGLGPPVIERATSSLGAASQTSIEGGSSPSQSGMMTRMLGGTTSTSRQHHQGTTFTADHNFLAPAPHATSTLYPQQNLNYRSRVVTAAAQTQTPQRFSSGPTISSPQSRARRQGLLANNSTGYKNFNRRATFPPRETRRRPRPNLNTTRGHLDVEQVTLEHQMNHLEQEHTYRHGNFYPTRVENVPASASSSSDVRVVTAKNMLVAAAAPTTAGTTAGSAQTTTTYNTDAEMAAAGEDPPTELEADDHDASSGNGGDADDEDVILSARRHDSFPSGNVSDSSCSRSQVILKPGPSTSEVHNQRVSTYLEAAAAARKLNLQRRASATRGATASGGRAGAPGGTTPPAAALLNRHLNQQRPATVAAARGQHGLRDLRLEQRRQLLHLQQQQELSTAQEDEPYLVHSPTQYGADTPYFGQNPPAYVEQKYANQVTGRQDETVQTPQQHRQPTSSSLEYHHLSSSSLVGVASSAVQTSHQTALHQLQHGGVITPPYHGGAQQTAGGASVVSTATTAPVYQHHINRSGAAAVLDHSTQQQRLARTTGAQNYQGPRLMSTTYQYGDGTSAAPAGLQHQHQLLGGVRPAQQQQQQPGRPQLAHHQPQLHPNRLQVQQQGTTPPLPPTHTTSYNNRLAVAPVPYILSPETSARQIISPGVSDPTSSTSRQFYNNPAPGGPRGAAVEVEQFPIHSPAMEETGYRELPPQTACGPAVFTKSSGTTVCYSSATTSSAGGPPTPACGAAPTSSSVEDGTTSIVKASPRSLPEVLQEQPLPHQQSGTLSLTSSHKSVSGGNDDHSPTTSTPAAGAGSCASPPGAGGSSPSVLVEEKKRNVEEEKLVYYNGQKSTGSSRGSRAAGATTVVDRPATTLEAEVTNPHLLQDRVAAIRDYTKAATTSAASMNPTQSHSARTHEGIPTSVYYQQQQFIVPHQQQQPRVVSREQMGNNYAGEASGDHTGVANSGNHAQVTTPEIQSRSVSRGNKDLLGIWWDTA